MAGLTFGSVQGPVPDRGWRSYNIFVEAFSLLGNNQVSYRAK
jgi:hypothetical protein